jgi:hypothetical protein
MRIPSRQGPFTAALLRGRFSFVATVALLTGFWFPALALGKVLVHGDSALVGLPLLRLLAGALRGRDCLLWISRVAGRHPLFAEGQGGFADPLNLFVAALFEPAYGIGFLHWMSVIVGAAGVFTLCRALEIRAWLATFSSISAAFSGAWIVSQDNLPISATIAWAPWLMVAVEHWLKAPSIARAACISISAACMVLAGYPLITYGTVLYLATSLLAEVLHGAGRRFFVSNWRAIVVSGISSAILAVALSAIQLLPLLELVSQSHRSGGTGMAFGGFTPTPNIYRGLLYFYIGPDQAAANVPNLGNMLVAALAGLTLFVETRPRVLGHLFGTLIILNIGMATASPLFSLVYDHHLLPGLHSYRIMHPLFAVAVIGLSVAAAFVLDRLATARARLWPFLEKRPAIAIICFASYLLAGSVACRTLYTSLLSWTSCVSLPLLAFGCALLIWRKQREWLPMFAVVALIVDVLLLRMNPFAFLDRQVLEPPAMIQTVLKDPSLQDYRVLSTTGADGMTFMSPKDPGLASSYARVLRSLGSFPGLQWNEPTLDGILALPLARWAAVFPVVQTEISAAAQMPTQLRLMDILGIRYVSMNSPTAIKSLSLIAQDDPLGLSIYRNGTARPRFQIYFHATFVEGIHDALTTLTGARRPLLVLERSYSGEKPQTARRETCEDWNRDHVYIKVIKASVTHYGVNADVPCDAWFFLADANYPGWRASVNGVAQPVFSAQILGKAVHLNAGHNRVLIDYVPRSFYLGAAITCVGVLVLLLIGARSWRASVARSNRR